MEVVLSGKVEWITLVKEGFAWGIWGREKLVKVVKDFSYTLRVPSTDCFKSIPTHKKRLFLKN